MSNPTRMQLSRQLVVGHNTIVAVEVKFTSSEEKSRVLVEGKSPKR